MCTFNLQISLKKRRDVENVKKYFLMLYGKNPHWQNTLQ